MLNPIEQMKGYEDPREASIYALDEFLRGLDQRVQDLDEWIERAATSLIRFEAKGGGMIRNTHSIDEKPGSTSTARALFALHEYRQHRLQEALPVDAKVEGVLRNGLEGWLLPLVDPARIEELANASENGKNLFTHSHLVIALTFAPALCDELGLGTVHALARPRLEEIRTELVADISDELNQKGILALTRGDAASHHFITLHGVRALDAAGHQVKNIAPVRSSVASTVLEQLGYHAAGVMARFDPGPLAFAASLLGRFKVADRKQLTDRAVAVVGEAQTDDGAWRSSQVVATQDKRRIYVSSYEVGLSLAFLSLRELKFGDIELAMNILPSLDKVMDLVRASYISEESRLDNLRGWANDRSRWPGLIESWSTASVLSFLLRFRELVLQLRQQLVLRRYGARSFEQLHSPLEWPDLELAFPVPQPARAVGGFRSYSDPSDEESLTQELKARIVDRAMSEPGGRPEKASLILYGPPGSRKTSLVRCMAEELGWPLLTLSPPDFLGDHGLDGFEGAAARVFEDLLRLRRVVVLFDECEDFFKPRRDERQRVRSQAKHESEQAPGQESSRQERPESRTIGAFLTAGMLPRLQKLRDYRWVIFVLATNIHDLAELDGAVRRPGRFDYAQRVGDPSLNAQCRYVDNHRRRHELGDSWAEAVKKALRDFANRDKGLVPFAVIDYVIATIIDDGMEVDKDKAEDLLFVRMENVENPPSLYVDGEARLSTD